MATLFSPNSELFDTEATAALLGVRPNTLEGWRTRGLGPRYLKFGPGRRAGVRYPRSEIQKWIERQTFASTSEHSVRRDDCGDAS